MLYQIKIIGELDRSWSEWLGDVQIQYEVDEDGAKITILIVNLTDPPALFGVLDRIRDLNLPLISVTPLKGALK